MNTLITIDPPGINCSISRHTNNTFCQFYFYGIQNKSLFLGYRYYFSYQNLHYDSDCSKQLLHHIYLGDSSLARLLSSFSEVFSCVLHFGQVLPN